MSNSTIVYTLVFIMNDEKKEILLGWKKRGFGKHLWNGFGGKLDENETLEQCAIREVNEECGLKLKNIVCNGYLLFNVTNIEHCMKVYIYTANEYTGNLKETNEMLPKWFHIEQIPFEKMLNDLSYWLPLVIDGKKFIGEFFSNEQNFVYKHSLKIL